MQLTKISVLTLFLALGTLLPAQTPAADTRVLDLEGALSRDGKDAAALKELGDFYFAKAAQGDKGAVDRALEITISLMEQNPTQALQLCRYGSLCTMKGRDLSLPLTKLWYVQRGLEAMEKAANQAPEDIGVRLTRARTCAALPPQFQAIGTAIEDCQRIEGTIAKNPERYPKPLRLQTKLLLASSLKKAGRDGEAAAIAAGIQAAAPGSPFAQQAQELLK